MPVQPLSIHDVDEQKYSAVPDEVIETFNELILEYYNPNTRRATFTQHQAIARILSKRPDIHRQTIFDQHWIDVEPLYRQAGWQVKYDKPGFDDYYDAYFEFTRP